MNFAVTQDAQQRALGFLMQQASLIEPTVYQWEYGELIYQRIVPVDFSAPEWVQSVTYTSMDAVGEAAWFSGKAQDINNVEVTRDKLETTVHMGGVGYRYDLEELGKAQMLGANLNADKAVAARRVAEEFIQKVALVGDASKGLNGMLNHASVTATTAPADGAASATTFASKDADKILRDINAILTGMGTLSIGMEMADTVLLPWQVLADIGTRRIDTVNQTTILQWIKANNVYTLTTGRELTIQGIFTHLDAAGAGGTGRMVAYRNSPDVLKMHVPMSYRFLPVWQHGPMLFEVPGIFRVGGVDVRRSAGVRYLDGI